jgi:glycosyltransferase involved in cell wall biosynthesis
VSGRLRLAWLGQRSPDAGNGLITYSREITRGLGERGADVVFVHHDPDGPASDRAGASSVALEALPVGDRFRVAAPGSARRLAAALSQHRVDLVHVSLSFSSLDFSLPALCHELGLPVVATFHAPFDTHATLWAGLSRMLYQIYAVPLARYDRVIVFGPSQAEMLAGMGVPRRVMRVVPNGVDVERYRPGLSDRAAALGARQLFLYLGRLDREKNVDLLVESFLAAGPPRHVRLALAGTGAERRRLERSHRDPRLVFLGSVNQESERIDLLRASSALFLPSAIEGLSLALLEAMACGACPVATDVGCDGDAVRGAGIVLDPTRLRVEVRMAVRLLSTTPGLAEHLGALARRRAVERYSLARNIDTLLGIYEELVGGALTSPGGSITIEPSWPPRYAC